MLSQSIARRTIQSSIRSFSTARVCLNEGSTGQGKDGFADREKAQENYYIKKHEADQLKALREKLENQKKAVSDLEQEIKDLKK